MAIARLAENQEACCGVGVDSPHEADAASDVVLADAATLFKALSDETRLRIIRTIARSPHELCECNIVPLFGLFLTRSTAAPSFPDGLIISRYLDIKARHLL